VVFIVGLEEGIFPHSRVAVSLSELEEERRLMYMALTRAKKQLYLLFSNERVLYGTTQMNPPSRFLDEIPEELCIEQVEENSDFLRPRKSFGYGGYQKKGPKTFMKPVAQVQSQTIDPGDTLTADSVRPGDMVYHQEFGNGLIIALSGNLATIAFKERGVKKMMLGMAPLKKV
jgi:DNA helicase-2/ATP-dependent DNA helicase PcrA